MLNVRILVCAKNFADSCCASFASARPLIVRQHKDAKRKTNCRTKRHFLLSNSPNSDDLLGIQYNPVGTFFFFSKARLSCHLTRTASTPTSGHEFDLQTRLGADGCSLFSAERGLREIRRPKPEIRKKPEIRNP